MCSPVWALHVPAVLREPSSLEVHGASDSNAVQGYAALKLAVPLGQSRYASIAKITRTTSWALFCLSSSYRSKIQWLCARSGSDGLTEMMLLRREGGQGEKVFKGSWEAVTSGLLLCT